MFRFPIQVVKRNLKNDGIFLLQCIGLNNKHMPSTAMWLDKYIFWNGRFPRMIDIVKVTDGQFVVEDWHSFGLDYGKTLQSWRENFNASWGNFENEYGERFHRMWIFYLCMCEGLFKSRTVQLWQIVLSKGGLKSDYRAAR